jgi:hypothetical protein
MKKPFLVAILFSGVLCSRCFGQSPEDIDHLITRRIDRDISYSGLYSVSLGDVVFLLQNANGIIVRLKDTTFSHGRETKSLTHRLYYLPYVEGDSSPVPVRIVRTTTTWRLRSIIGRPTRPSRNIDSPFNPIDFVLLRGSPGEYQKVQNYIRTAGGRPLANPIRPESEAQIGSPNENDDYLNFAKVHNRHLYSEPHGNNTNWYADLSLNLWKPLPSKVTVSHSFLTSSTWLGLRGFGFEAGLNEDEVLNFLTYQTPYFNVGTRFLLTFPSESADLRKANFLDLRILLRKSRGNTGYYVRRVSDSGPFFSVPVPKVNVTSGATFSLATSVLRLFDWPPLPPLNLYFSVGSNDFANPHLLSSGGESAYFSRSQFEATLSFYWNSNNDTAFLVRSGKALNQFRLDLGVASYDIWRVRYSIGNRVLDSSEEVSLGDFRPVLSLEYTHASTMARFGARIRLFDNRIKLGAWIKVFSVGPHEVRLESEYVTSPVGRPQKDWEAEGGNILQLEYRFGF